MSYNNGFSGVQGNFQVPPMNPVQQQINRLMELQNQQNQQQAQNQQAQPTTNVNFVSVSSWGQAKEQIVPNGMTIWMKDTDKPYLYVKSVNNIGTPTYNVLKFEEVTDNFLKGTESQQPISNVPEGYDLLKQQVSALEQKVGQYEILISSFLKGQQPQIEVPQVQVEEKKPTTTKRGNSNQKVGE